MLPLSEGKSQLQKEPQRPTGPSPGWKALLKPTGQARHPSKPGLAVGRSQQQIACAWAGADHSASRSISREQSSSHPHPPRVHSKDSKPCNSWAAIQGSYGWRLRVTSALGQSNHSRMKMDKSLLWIRLWTVRDLKALSQAYCTGKKST